MHARIIRLDIPDIEAADLDQLASGLTMMAAVSATSPQVDRRLRMAARIVEAVRLGLLAGDAEEEDRAHMSEGEVAIVRNLKIISSKLDTLISKGGTNGRTLEAPKPDGN